MKHRIARVVLLLSYALLFWVGGIAQTGVVKGKVVDPDNQPIAGVNIEVLTTNYGGKTAENGSYRLLLPSGKVYRIRFTHSGHRSSILELEIATGRTYDEPIKMLPLQVDGVDIIGEQDPTSINDRDAMLVSPIQMEDVLKMPTIAPSVEAMMKGMPGVATNNEFSSQYQVRGGNFDENLVYVNGIEIYRPFLARAGQQEGLGFSNPSMAQSLKFSTGGFGAQYGDKLSSVLDITYRTPKSFRATVEAGIISTNLHVEGISKNKKDPQKPGKFTYLMGARRFAMAYLLNSLETRGDYRPSFLDYQGMLTYTPKNRSRPARIRTKTNGRSDTLYYVDEPLKFTTFFAVTRNRFQFIPTERVTTTGTIQQAFRLATLFQGQEVSAYTTGLGAVMLEHQPNTRLKLDYILTTFRTEESELFDLEGYYLLGEVNTNFGSSEFGETEFDLGVGSQFRSGRNYLSATVIAGQVKGAWTANNSASHRLLFGLKAQRQVITDNLREYQALDSAGYLVDTLGLFGLDETVRAQNQLNSQLYKGFIQHEWQLNRSLSLHTGTRLAYYDLIDRWMVSPRVQLLAKLMREPSGETKLRLRLAGGIYQQPPFYREMRRFDGTVNLDIKPQSSLHLITGLDYRFFAWNRPFRLFAEAYYKRLYNLVPYEIENVRIRYYPDKVADGYAYGLDLRLNGEFIKGVDSWVSLGLLKTEEDILGDEIGYIPRPTDQRFTFAMYFQDELPINPTYKVHLSYIYGSGMRFGPPRTFDLRTSFGFPAYHRADLGFSKMITFLGEGKRSRQLESLWITVEVYNVFQRQNTVSYGWFKDLQNNRFAVPNRLSARLLNARLILKIR